MSESINETGEIPVSKTLESLLTDVEFVIEDSSCQESTQVTEIRDSIVTEDNSEDTREEVNDVTEDNSEDSREEVNEKENGLPEHSFYTNTIMGKTGRYKGVKRITFKLNIGCYTFTKNKDYKDP